jgi:protein-S-isoprenylcysteine O-methyltransferase Ste14
MTYVRQMAPNAFLLLLLMLFVVSVQALMNASDWWLNKWYCSNGLSIEI